MFTNLGLVKFISSTLLFSFCNIFYANQELIENTKASLEGKNSESSSFLLPKLAKTFVILVHGTFASQSSWHSEKSGFYQNLKTQCAKVYSNFSIESFIWSGALSAVGRLDGSIKLAKRISQIKEADPESAVVCIGHSHGGNVIMMASQMANISRSFSMLGQENCRGALLSLICQDLLSGDPEQRSVQTDSDPMIHTIDTISEIEKSAQMIKECLTRGDISTKICAIDEVFLLATPINPKIYSPCSSSIKKIYSIYSAGDMIQIYSPIYKRRFLDFGTLEEFLPTEIIEFKVELLSNEKDKVITNPGHLEMNDSWMGFGLLTLPTSAKIHSIIQDRQKTSQFSVRFYKDCSKEPVVTNL